MKWELNLEEGVKVPEGGLDVVVGRHLREPHLQEDVPELRTHLEEKSISFADSLMFLRLMKLDSFIFKPNLPGM